MKKKNPSQISKTSGRVRRGGEPSAWRYRLLFAFCGMLVVGGLFYAARQHFSAMDYGIKNAKLRQQKTDLEAERRRLSLARDVALSPNEIKKAAKKVGFREYAVSSVETVARQVESINPFDKNKTPETTKKAFLPKTASAAKDKETAKPEKEFKAENKPKPTATTAGDVRQRIAKK